MARAAGLRELYKIEVSKSRTPLSEGPDLCSVAVLYVTDAEAKAIGELAMMLQKARTNGQDQFVVGVRRPMKCRNGHPNQIEGELCQECERESGARNTREALMRAPTEPSYRALPWRPSGWVQCINGHPIQNFGDVCMECKREGLAPIVPINLKDGMILDTVPFGWTIEFSPSENAYSLMDQYRTPRATVQKMSVGNQLLMIKVFGTEPEPELEKIVGDAARFAGIDFDD